MRAAWYWATGLERLRRWLATTFLGIDRWILELARMADSFGNAFPVVVPR